MPLPVDIFACIVDPTSDDCMEAKRFFRDLLEAQYLARFFKFPPIKVPFPPPDPNSLEADGISSVLVTNRLLIGELLMHALGSTHSGSPLIDDIRNSGIQLEVVEQLIEKFEGAASALKKEAEILQK